MYYNIVEKIYKEKNKWQMQIMARTLGTGVNLRLEKLFVKIYFQKKVTSMDEYILQTTDEMQKPYSRGVSIGVGVFLYMETLCVIKKRRIVDKLFATPKMSKVRLFSVAFDIAVKFDRYKFMSNEDISKYCLYYNISDKDVVYRGWRIASASSLAQKALYDKWG